MAKMLRPQRIYGENKPIPVGKTVFWENFVYNENGEAEQFIPGTDIPRLRLVRIGKRAVAAFEDEVDALIEALRRERDRGPQQTPPAPRRKRVKTVPAPTFAQAR